MPGPSEVYFSSAKVAPVDHVPTYSRDLGRTQSSLSQHSKHSQHSRHSQHSSNSQLLKTAGSHDATSLPPMRRKRPLAVAVGFKYAEDLDGRPIVITPGNRRMPVHDQRSDRSPVSPSSETVNVTRKEVNSSLFLPLITDVDMKTEKAHDMNTEKAPGATQLIMRPPASSGT